jgi:hypothetical protein
MMEFAVLAALALIFMYLHSKIVKKRGKYLIHYETAINDFIEAAHALLGDSDTPEGVIDLLQFMRMKAERRSSARYFLWYLLMKRKELIGPSGSKLREMEEFFKKRPELSTAFSRACSAAFEALTYRSPLAGPLLRRFVLFDVSRNRKRVQELAESYREIECDDQDHDHHEDGLVPA